MASASPLSALRGADALELTSLGFECDAPVAAAFYWNAALRALGPREDSWGLSLVLAVIPVNSQPTLCAVREQTLYSVDASQLASLGCHAACLSCSSARGSLSGFRSHLAWPDNHSVGCLVARARCMGSGYREPAWEGGGVTQIHKGQPCCTHEDSETENRFIPNNGGIS